MEPDPDVQAKRDLTYGRFDLGSLSIFSGSYINFGYWGDLEPDREITVEERAESHAANRVTPRQAAAKAIAIRREL